MADGHLAVPNSTREGTFIESNGRPRSVSSRSSRSAHSRVVGPGPGPGGAEERECGENYARRPSIRIRRSMNFPLVQQNWGNNAGQGREQNQNQNHELGNIGRRSRSSSAPSDHHLAGHGAGLGGVSELPAVAEEITSPTDGNTRLPGATVTRDYALDGEHCETQYSSTKPAKGWRMIRRTKTGGWEETASKRGSGVSSEREYDEDLVDLLDLVDPEVATLSTLTNVQNSLFVPDLGKYLNRRPTYNLTRPQFDTSGDTSLSDYADNGIKSSTKKTTRPNTFRAESGATLDTLNSKVNERYYAVLPHGVLLNDWTEEEKLELNDHVRHMLHSKRSKFKRAMKGFGQYFRTPLGAFVTIYATLITLFGLAWVLFLIGWINVGGKQLYTINVIDNVLVALFAIMGDGLAPFRAVDTYHMCFIAHYHHLTWKLRKQKSLPALHNKNDLPLQSSDVEAQNQTRGEREGEQTEDDMDDKAEYSILTPKQVARLTHHQTKFSKSHSFYKPHETPTHHAFPLRLLIAIVVLLDCHSFLQIALGTCTWAINYKVRPFALTTVILCCSITCNITAGVLITVGDRKTRKKNVKERMFRQELTAEAMGKMRRGKEREMERNGELEGEGKIPEEGVMQPLGHLTELDLGEFGVDDGEGKAEGKRRRDVGGGIAGKRGSGVEENRSVEQFPDFIEWEAERGIERRRP